VVTNHYYVGSHVDQRDYYRIINLSPSVKLFGWSKLSDLLEPLIRKLPYAVEQYTDLLSRKAIDFSPSVLHTIYNLWLMKPNRLHPNNLTRVLNDFRHMNAHSFTEKMADNMIEDASADTIKRVLDISLENCNHPVSKTDIALRKLIQHRLSYMQQIASRPLLPFSWCMRQANFPGRPELESFLQGPLETVTVKGFDGIAQARHLKFRLEQESSAKFSVIGEPKGVGKNAKLVVTKTRRWYEEYVSSLQAMSPNGPEGLRLKRLMG
jgi:hypothetical protein